jgi:hypothetical protein
MKMIMLSWVEKSDETMQDEPFPAAERILSEIETVFKKDSKL